MDLELVEKWKVTFLNENNKSPKSWIYKRHQLLCDLKSLFESSLRIIRGSTSELDTTKAKKRVKFCLNRLGRLGFEELTDIVIQLLIDVPWILNVRRVCEDLVLQGKEKELLYALGILLQKQEEEWGSIRANIIKALAKSSYLSEESLKVIENIAFYGKTDAERLMASELLFFFRSKVNTTRSEVYRKIISRREHSSIAKNYVLLFPFSRGRLGEVHFNYKYHDYINEVIQVSKNEAYINELYKEEPDILRQNFYESDYPDDDREFPDLPSNAF
jgi:hypothetical protein